MNILGGGVDVTVERELHGDGGAALRVRRTHLLHAGDGGELALQRCGDGGRHGFRAGPRERRAHLNGGIVDGGQCGHGQAAEGDQTENQNRQHGQRGHDGAFDEDFRGVHDYAPVFGCTGSSKTGAPGNNNSCPSVTTRSPAASPLLMTTLRSSVWPTVTRRASTVLSAFTT